MGAGDNEALSKARTVRARRLRRDSTDAERALWRLLRSRITGHKFRRQHPIGPYFADFACVELKLVIELDGGQHDAQRDKDAKRTVHLQALGWRVVRFWNPEVLTNIDGVWQQLTAIFEVSRAR